MAPGIRIRTADDLRAALAGHGWTRTADGRDLCFCCNPAEDWLGVESRAEQASWASKADAIKWHK